MNNKVLIAGSLVLALAACNKSGQQTAAGGNTAVPVGALGNGAGEATAAPAAAAGATMVQPGLWEVSYEANVSGANLPPAYAAAMKSHKETKRDCITPEEAAKPINMMKSSKDDSCDYSKFTLANGHMQGTITCGEKGGSGKASMTMNGQYDAQNYAYTSTMTSNAGGMNMTIETKAIGHRVGECPAGGAG